jgi:predicted dehydrogenase
MTSAHRRLRVGIVGLGYIGSGADEHVKSPPGLTHASAYQANSSAELVAGADPDPGRRETFARARGAATYADYAEMLDRETLDVVSICTPSDLRLPVIRAALANGIRAIFCEKPLGSTLDEAKLIEQETSAAGVPLVLGYLRRWDPAVRQVKAMLERAELGTIQHGVGRYTKGIVHNGSHLIDLVAYLGACVESVQAFTEPRDDRIGEDRTLDLRLVASTRNGSYPLYFTAADYRHYSVFELDLVGSLGRACMTDGGRIWRISRRMADPVHTTFTVLAPGTELHGDSRRAMLAAVDEVLHAARGEQPRGTCTAQDGVYALKVACAALASADRRIVFTI